jgi:hypothetical protein
MGVFRETKSSRIEHQPESARSFHVLTLACGHTKNVIARREGGGFDSPPAGALCDECDSGPVAEVAGGGEELTAEVDPGKTDRPKEDTTKK